MIRLFNGHELEYLAASGALGLTGRGYFWDKPFLWCGLLRPEEFVFVTKTLTLYPQKGNHCWWRPFQTFRFLENGNTLNALALPNPGFSAWIDDYYPVVQSYGYRVIPSIAPKNVKEATLMALSFNGTDIVALEVNFCPNTEKVNDEVEIVRAVLGHTIHPVTVKLGIDNYKRVCKVLDGEVSAFDLINAVPWKHLRSGESPLEEFGGGAISGPEIRWYSREALSWAKANCKTPVISCGGIDRKSEVDTRWKLGADAVSFGTLFLRRPWRPNMIVKEARSEKRV